MKLTKNLFSVIIFATLALSLLTGCGSAASSAASSFAASAPAVSAAVSETTPANEITSTFTVTYADGATEAFSLSCDDGATLADALLDAGIISKEEHDAGFVTTVNGVTADYNADKAWWSLLDKDGEMTAVGISEIILADGDAYSFAYTIG